LERRASAHARGVQYRQDAGGLAVPPGGGGHLDDVSVGDVTVQALGVERALGRVIEGDVDLDDLDDLTSLMPCRWRAVQFPCTYFRELKLS